jgi:hypothetical protein
VGACVADCTLPLLVVELELVVVPVDVVPSAVLEPADDVPAYEAAAT